jgi:hypothetical protein
MIKRRIKETTKYIKQIFQILKSNILEKFIIKIIDQRVSCCDIWILILYFKLEFMTEINHITVNYV